MNPLVLLAELLAHGINVEPRDGAWYYVGVDASAELGSLGVDIDAHHLELETYLTDMEGSENAR
jgi:hypothetical protein